MPVPFPGLNVDETQAPLRPDLHLVLRTMVLYVAHNDGFAPDRFELAEWTGWHVHEVVALQDDLVSMGLAKRDGGGCYPTTPGVAVPPVKGEPSREEVIELRGVVA